MTNNTIFSSQSIDHLSLSVTNLEKSANFYKNILGFNLKQIPTNYPNKLNAGAYYFNIGSTEITLLSHKETKKTDKFSEFRVGLDHISFRVNQEKMLKNLVINLNKNEIKNSGIEIYKPNNKKYVVVRDPDNIQLEFWLDQNTQNNAQADDDKEEKEWMQELYNKARELVIKNNKASITFLQRKLWIDFRRASKILNLLEKNGVVGKEDGIKPRKILAKNL